MKTKVLLVSAVTFLLTACGGGNSPPGFQTAALSGVVRRVNGEATNRSGIYIRVIETGDEAVTDDLGRFSFSAVPTGKLDLWIGESPIEFRGESNWTLDDVSGDIELRLSLREGEVDDLLMTEPGRDLGEERLHPAPGAPDGVRGVVAAEFSETRDELRAEISGLAAGDVVEFFLDDYSLVTGFESVGTAVASANGTAHLRLTSFPFGAASVLDVADFGVEVRLVSSAASLLGGFVPNLFVEPVPELPPLERPGEK